MKERKERQRTEGRTNEEHQLIPVYPRSVAPARLLVAKLTAAAHSARATVPTFPFRTATTTDRKSRPAKQAPDTTVLVRD